jgi:two-component system, OmpR family, alkaline phosphatase synthesis response regulator PhoP
MTKGGHMDRKKILIVDDDETFTRMVKVNLESTDKYTVRVENKGASALDAARIFNPHLILLDIVMPDMAGSDIATQLKEDERCKVIPVIFLTALVTNEETEHSCDKRCGYPFIAKPVNLKTLITCIEQNLTK